MEQINRITGTILNTALHIHSDLGPGLFESVYENVLAYELEEAGLRVERQVEVPIKYKKLSVDCAFRADLIVERCVVVEVKSIAQLAPVHSKQLLTYLRLLDYRVGILINFGQNSLKDGFKRIANGVR